MDRTVPPGAAHLLAFIYRTETGRNPPECYEVIYGHNQGRLPKPITSMTLDEVEAAQAGWSKQFGSSAAGAAQFMRNTLDAPKTLRDIEGEMGLTGRELFSPELQDRMAYHLLKRRGYLEFISGGMSREAFGNRLAMEWASFPVLSTSLKGAHRTVKRGQTYYAGDGVNKVLTKPDTVEQVLEEVLALAAEPVQAPEPLPRPTVPTMPLQPAGEFGKPNLWPMIAIGIIAALVGITVWLFGAGAANAQAPVPMDRPVSLFGGPGGQAPNIFGEIAMQIALSFLMPIISAAVTAFVGWIGYMWAKWFKTGFDQRSADMLHAALERGVLAMVERFGTGNKAAVLQGAADYAEQWSGGTVRKFGLGPADLQALAEPHLAKVKRRF